MPNVHVSPLIRQVRRHARRLAVGSRAGERRGHDRSFVPAGLTPEAWLASLHEAGIDPVLLGDPDDLERELVLLVDDDDLTRLRPMMHRRGRTRCRVYGVEGRAGGQYRGLALMPPARARELLAHAGGRPRWPRPEDHFLFQAYRQVYHLGSPPEGERAARLAALRRRAGLETDMGLASLEALLQARGWCPPLDTREKLAAGNAWLQASLEAQRRRLPAAHRGLGTFIVRERGLDHLQMVRDALFDAGFDLLGEGGIDPAAQPAAAAEIRGGNWGRGPWPESGGEPVYYLVVHDARPMAVGATMADQHPGLDNLRLHGAKQLVRDRFNASLPVNRRCNILHSADNARQAMAYLETMAPGRLPGWLAAAEGCQAGFCHPYPVLADLSGNARRAKVELIDFHGRQAICKTFRRGRERYLQREVEARRVGQGLAEISQLLEVGPNYIVIEYYRNELPSLSPLRPWRHRHPFVPLWVVERLKAVILHYRRQGYECIDLCPKNLVYDPERGLKIIDFEFLQYLGEPRDGLAGNYAWFTPPSDFRGDFPVFRNPRGLYRRYWLSYTGLPRFFCLHAFPGPVLQCVRGLTFGYYCLANSYARGLKRRRHGSPVMH
ncbi:hypothetical protein [Halomonas getboli]|uniref:hypothetical protein n=1 Tax=Halomonas getboli TaxID=2935862 RepID=UPI001FFE943F|nr:hypothetical protein [Halomonas getboli]MCK2183063.1 hypothetical protein [Halomonas getboli]